MADLDGDGIDDALEGTLRVAVTAAGRTGEMIARQREQQMRAAQARSQQEASELGARLAGERDAARASLTTVYRPEWWDAAQPGDIARAYQTARAWGDVDPEAVRAEQRIAQELRDRYGVELPEQVASNPASVREALNSAEEARNTTAGEMAAAERDVVEGVGLIAQADAIDAAADELDQRVHDLLSDHADRVDEFESPPAADAEQLVDPTPAREPDPARQAEADQLTETAHDMRGDAQQLDDRGQVAYDSADRRRAMAAGMEGKASAATVDARVTADVAQAKPATEATRVEQRPRPESPPQPVPGQPGGPEGHHPLGIDPSPRADRHPRHGPRLAGLRGAAPRVPGTDPAGPAPVRGINGSNRAQSSSVNTGDLATQTLGPPPSPSARACLATLATGLGRADALQDSHRGGAGPRGLS